MNKDKDIYKVNQTTGLIEIPTPDEMEYHANETMPEHMKRKLIKPNKLIRYSRTRYLDNFAYYANDTIIGRSIELYGEYTQPEIELLRQFINKESVVYDIGANIGYHTIAFATMCDQVYAFEPNHKHIQLLKHNIESFDNVHLFQKAVSDEEGTITVQDFDLEKPGNYGECHVGKDGYKVDTVTIDQLDNIYAPDVIKIDVEGHELQVIKGSLETIQDHKPYIFYEAHGTDLDEIYDILSGLGYNLYWYPCYNYNQKNFNNNYMNVFGQGGVLNIFAVHGHQITNLIPHKRGQGWDDARKELIAKLQEEQNGQDNRDV